MNNRIITSIIFSLFIFNFSSGTARSEPVTQTFTMSPGWNAVFLEVQPASTAPADVFANIVDAATGTVDRSGDLISVWMWNPQTGTVEFIQDPNTLIPGGPQMLAYLPGDPLLTNLHAIHGNTAYLVQLGGTSDVILTVNGEPKVPWPNWKANSFNFAGFYLSPGQEPFFDAFFMSSPAHNGQEIYILNNASGNWEQVTNPATTQMNRGEAFWVFCKGSSEFTGPLSVQLEDTSGVHYGKKLSEQDVFIHNNSAAEMNVSLSVPSLPGNTLYYWVFDPVAEVASWVEVPASLSLTIPADESQRLRLGVKRAGLTADVTYVSNMQVTDNAMTLLVPVSVTGIGYSGLWVGNATINMVNEPANSADPTTEVTTGSEFSFRLILHADDTGNVRLLSQVIQMWQEGTWKPDPDFPGKLIIDQPGYFVLFVDDTLIPNYSGSAMRDGQLVGRRISSPAFPALTLDNGSMDGEAVSGATFDPSPDSDLSVPDTDLHIQITLAQDDTTNPFRHMFHPDHKVTSQSYEVVRDIIFTFSNVDIAGRPITGASTLNWGSAEIGGVYSETMTGLHRNTLRTRGTFVLRKVSEIGTLEVAP